MPRKRENEKIICFYAPAEVQQQLRIKVAEEDTTQQDWLFTLVINALNEVSENEGAEEMLTPEKLDETVLVLRELAKKIETKHSQMAERFLRNLLNDELSLADINLAAKALKVDPTELQKIKKCGNGSNNVNASETC